MRISRLSLVVAGAAAVALAGSAARATVGITCTTPTLAECHDPGYFQTTCGMGQEPTCFRLAYDAHPAPETLVAFPDALLSGGVTTASTKELDLGKEGRFDPNELRLATDIEASFVDPVPGCSYGGACGLTAPLAGPLADPKAYLKYPAYEAQSDIADCRDYVYKKFHSYERFEHAAARCADAECVFDVAYAPGAPGISSRTLARKDGVPMTQQIELATGRLPKNTFFTAPVSLLKQSTKYKSDPARYDAMLAHILANRGYYGIGSLAGAAQKPYADAWQWHADLKEQTKLVSRAELRQNKKRQAKLQKLLDELSIMVIREAVGYDKAPDVSDLLDMAAPGPSDGPDFAFTAPARRDPFQLGRATLAIHDGASEGALLLKGDWYRWVAEHPSDLPPAELAAKPPAPAPLAVPMSGPGVGSATYGTVSVPSAGWTPSVVYSGAPDDILDMLEEEWLRPNGSCLSTWYAGCDWSYDMFESSVVGLFQQEREQAFRYCRGAFPAGFPAPHPATVDAAEGVIAEKRALFGAQIKGLEPATRKAPSLPAVGDEKKGTKDIGVPGFLGAHYDYEFSWRAEVTERSGGNICKVGAEAKAIFNAAAWYPNLDPTKGSVPAETMSLVEMKHAVKIGAASVTYESKLKIAGKDVYTAIQEGTTLVPGEVTRSPAPLPVPPIAETSATFVVVIVPVTVAFQLDLDRGVDWWLQATPAGACAGGPNPEKSVSMGLDAHVTPYLSAKLHASVAIGVPGFGAGLDGELELVTVKAPVHAKAYAAAGAGTGEVDLVLDHDAKLTFDELGGRLSAFVELPLLYPLVSKRFDQEIFSWRGLHQEFGLWRHTNKFSVLAFDAMP